MYPLHIVKHPDMCSQPGFFYGSGDGIPFLIRPGRSMYPVPMRHFFPVLFGRGRYRPLLTVKRIEFWMGK